MGRGCLCAYVGGGGGVWVERGSSVIVWLGAGGGCLPLFTMRVFMVIYAVAPTRPPAHLLDHAEVIVASRACVCTCGEATLVALSEAVSCWLRGPARICGTAAPPSLRNVPRRWETARVKR